ncbi:MAG: hypothetical protein ABI563_09215, partial [Specibacter sp.]
MPENDVPQNKENIPVDTPPAGESVAAAGSTGASPAKAPAGDGSPVRPAKNPPRAGKPATEGTAEKSKSEPSKAQTPKA